MNERPPLNRRAQLRAYYYRARRFGDAALSSLAGHADDLLFTAGLACMSWGCYLAWAPLGFMVPGSIVCGVILLSWTRRPPPRSPVA